MPEKLVSYDSHRPLIGKGVTLMDEPNVTRYGVMTGENMARFVMDVPARVGGIKSKVLINGVETEVLVGGVIVPMPTVRVGEKLPFERVIYEVRDDMDYLITDYGNIPIGGFEQKSFRTFDGKNAYMHLVVPAYIGPDEQKILLRRVRSQQPQNRNVEVGRINKMLPKVSFYEDKGLMFQVGNDPILILTPNGPVINKHIREKELLMDYNFSEGRRNQKLQPNDEDCFFFEFAIDQPDDVLLGSEEIESRKYMIAGVSFPRSVDFDYINTYIKTYIENGGKLTDDLVRNELMHPYLEVLTKDSGSTNG